MSSAARRLNSVHLELLESASAKTFGRIRTLWWDGFIEGVKRTGPLVAINNLDAFMDGGHKGLLEMAAKYAQQKGLGSDTAKNMQLQTQVLKSNTGKMFERFIGLAIAYVLHELNSPYCILPFATPYLKCCPGLTRDHFMVKVMLGKKPLDTHVDADLFVFNPEKPAAELLQISVKSTLKDRFHNVPFWNLLRHAAIGSHISPTVYAPYADALKRVKYVAICSDLAKQQPDFGTESGARNLLQVDAALLDGAYVTSTRAKGVATHGKHLGHDRESAFFRLSCLIEYLMTGKNE